MQIVNLFISRNYHDYYCYKSLLLLLLVVVVVVLLLLLLLLLLFFIIFIIFIIIIVIIIIIIIIIIVTMNMFISKQFIWFSPFFSFFRWGEQYRHAGDPADSVHPAAGGAVCHHPGAEQRGAVGHAGRHPGEAGTLLQGHAPAFRADHLRDTRHPHQGAQAIPHRWA